MSLVRAFGVLTAAVALIVACGSEDSSTFNPEVTGVDASSGSSSGGFNVTDAGANPDVTGPVNCKPLTCAEQGIECGPAGDGCGGLIMDCGKCGAGLRCGGPGSPSKCVSPNVGTACTPKTCGDLGINCGPAGDGCGGIIASCGTCGSGKQCGNATTPSQCVDATPTGPDGGACVKKTCADYLALGMDCGKQSDGCGGEIDCLGCPNAGDFCGGAGPSKCGNPATCVKKTCADYPADTCGPQSDDCGGTTSNCGTCTKPGEICGGGGVPSKCGGGTVLGPDGGACVPKSVCGANECGDVADGCGGILACGTANCTGGTICGGAGTPNQCGAPACVKNPASQAAACAGKNCGVVADGCGGVWVCGGANACTPPAICGGGGVANVCGGGVVLVDGGTCTPKTAANCTAGQCGPFADGCGGIYNCGSCAAGTGTCGGITPGMCGGGNQCTAKTKAEACIQTTGTNIGQPMSCGYAPDGCGGFHICGNNSGACPTGQACGIFNPNECGSLSGPCINNTTTTCLNNQMCCSGLCGALGKCIPTLADGGTPTCGNVGAACTGGNTCCSGVCTNGACATGNGGACLAAGTTCTTDNQCCSKGCIADSTGVKRCSLATSWCRQLNESCTTNSQCCNGKCTGATATAAGKCESAGSGGGLSCKVAGTVMLDCSSKTTQVCHQDCCSGSCGPHGTLAPGYSICQQPSGCAPLGELCQDSTNCCQGLPYPVDGGSWPQTPISCNGVVNGGPNNTFGRCNGGGGCSKPGEMCKTATDSCSFSNSCCEPPDIALAGGGNCQNNNGACCKHDHLGIPRCVGTAVCRPAGQTCNTSAECCPDPVTGIPPPCTDHDNDPATPEVCANQACIPTDGFCSVDGDCCNNNCYRQAPGDTTGQCKIPTCTPKTCAQLPGYDPSGGDGALCGINSDGCGGQLNCGPCNVPGQTCGGGGPGDPGVPNRCGGTVCNPLQACPANLECGDIPDGCGGTVHCGDCTVAQGHLPGETCGGGGQAYICGKPSCNPIDCAAQGLQCGQTGNGCGTVIDCPPCPAGQTCGGGGTPNQCGAPNCQPKACPAGLNCGMYPNGCGGSVSCGDCPLGQTCGGGGTPNVCGTATCSPKTCAQQYPTGIKNCGLISDLCGDVVSCGVCPAGQTCVDNECIGSACVPKTCAQLQVECGQVANGCGGLTPDCGPCPAGQGCGAGGVPNKCGSQPCTPKTCQDVGAVCGQVANGCGGLTPSCGDCGGNLACKNGACVQACTPRTCGEAGAQCGYIADGCGGVVDCGVCPDGYECGYNGQANKCGRNNPN